MASDFYVCKCWLAYYYLEHITIESIRMIKNFLKRIKMIFAELQHLNLERKSIEEKHPILKKNKRNFYRLFNPLYLVLMALLFIWAFTSSVVLMLDGNILSGIFFILLFIFMAIFFAVMLIIR